MVAASIELALRMQIDSEGKAKFYACFGSRSLLISIPDTYPIDGHAHDRQKVAGGTWVVQENNYLSRRLHLNSLRVNCDRYDIQDRT